MWEFNYAGTQYLQYHDVEMLPNGNVLIIAWEMKRQTEVINQGRNPSLLSEGELWPASLRFSPVAVQAGR